MNHSEKDKEVFDFLNEVVLDVGTIFRTNAEGKELVSQRVQLIATFTLIDVIASYWYEYDNRTGTQQQRFLDWVKAYCLIEKNPEYTTDSDLQKITPTRLYSFRSSMVHFFGMSEPSENCFITVASNSLLQAQITAWRKGFADRGHPVAIIKTRDLYNLVTEGAILMLADMNKVIEESAKDESKKRSHIAGIDRVFQKIKKEGAKKISLSH